MPLHPLFDDLRGTRKEVRHARGEQRGVHDIPLPPVIDDAMGAEHGQVFGNGGAIRSDELGETELPPILDTFLLEN